MAKKKDENNKELIKELNINKKDLVNEIKNDIKEQLEEEIIKKVDYETRNKLDKMERRIYRQKSWALIRRDIIILLFLGLIIYEGKILYDNGLLFGLNKDVKETEVISDKDNKVSEEIEEVKDLAWYTEKYGYLLDRINTNLNDEDKYYLYLSNYEYTDIKNSVKLNMAYQLINAKSDDGVIKFDSSELEVMYKKIFNDEYVAENFNNDCINFIYNKKSDNYMAIDLECESDNSEIIKKIKNIYEEEDKIVIECKVGILNKDSNVISTFNGEEFEYNDDNIENLNTYKFTFKDSYLYKIEME